MDDADLAAAHDAGLTDSELVEVITEVALSTLTSYVNRFPQLECDIPRTPVERVATR